MWFSRLHDLLCIEDPKLVSTSHSLVIDLRIRFLVNLFEDLGERFV